MFGKIIRLILRLLIFALTPLATIFAVLILTFYEPNFYLTAMTDDAYIDAIKDGFDAEAAIIARTASFPAESVTGLISQAEIVEISQTAANGVFDALVNGGNIVKADYPMSKFLTAIRETAEEGGLDEKIYPNEESYTILAEKFKDTADNQLNGFYQSGLFSKTNEYLNKPLVFGMSANTLLTRFNAAVLFTVLTILVILSLLGRRRGLPKELYLTGAASFCGSAIVTVALVMLQIFNITARLPLAASPFKSFLTTIINTFTEKAALYSCILTAAAALMLVIGAAMTVVNGKLKVESGMENEG